MIGLQILTLVLIALSASLAAVVTWLLVRGRAPAAPVDDIEAPRAAELAPGSGAEIAALKQAIAGLIDGQAERDNRLLMEIRATALTKDPAVTDALRRIETALGTALQDPPQDETGDADSETDPSEGQLAELVTEPDAPSDPEDTPAEAPEDPEPAAPERNIRMG